jgi:hypothetical protein
MPPAQPFSAGPKRQLAALFAPASRHAEHERIRCVWWRAARGLSSQQMAAVLGWPPGSVRNLQARVWREGLGLLEPPGRGGTTPRPPHPSGRRSAAGWFLFGRWPRRCGRGRSAAGRLGKTGGARGGKKHPAAAAGPTRRAHTGAPSLPPGGQCPDTAGLQKELRRGVRAEAARQAGAGRSLRLLFADEARFGRLSDPRRAWAPRPAGGPAGRPRAGASTARPMRR